MCDILNRIKFMDLLCTSASGYPWCWVALLDVEI